MAKKRMSAEARRAAIVAAVAPVFARRGFEGATTRQLAAAAGVSEALLYRHFPSKEDLYRAIGTSHFADRDLHPGFDRLVAMEPSTERLVLVVQYLVAHVAEAEDDTEFPRLMARSLLGDGAFAAAVFRQLDRNLRPLVEQSLAAARRAGDLVETSGPGRDDAALWLVQFLAFGMRLFSLPGTVVVPWKASRSERADAAVRFALRGVGVKSEAIERCYDPDAWRRLGA